MSIPGSISTNKNLSKTIMNNQLHHQQFLFDNLKNPHLNKISSTSNFSFDPDLLRELNARYLHEMNAGSTINENGFSTFLRAKHYHQHTHTHEHNLNILSSVNDKLSKSNDNLTKKSNKWCTAHVRISWMIYHQQQQHLKDKLSLSDGKKNEEQQSLLNNKLPDVISNIKPILPFASNDSSFLSQPAFNYRSPFDVSNNSFGGLGSLFPSNRKPDMNVSIPPLNFNSSQFHRGIESFPSIKFDEMNRKHFLSVVNDNHRNSYHHLTNQNSSLSRKVSSDNSKSSSHSLPSTFPTFDPLTLSIIERQRLSAAYASQGKNIDPTIFRNNNNNNSSSPFSNLDSSAMISALVQREHFLNLLRLSQQQHEHERGTIVDSNPVQINKTLKTKFEQISPINKDKTKRIKLENPASPTSNSSTSSSIKSKHVKREKLLSSSSSIASTIQTHDLTSKDDSIPSMSTTT